MLSWIRRDLRRAFYIEARGDPFGCFLGHPARAACDLVRDLVNTLEVQLQSGANRGLYRANPEPVRWPARVSLGGD